MLWEYGQSRGGVAKAAEGLPRLWGVTKAEGA